MDLGDLTSALGDIMMSVGGYHRSALDLYHFKLCYMVLHTAVKEFLRIPLLNMEKLAILIFRVIFDQP